ncbi:helix-turn-helix transcriptional regulator [Endozoicomonas acroporae]|uniref:helix-turn-helix transcriptional regulator n=1 Tax=Endozoicomonas acroporae TaxID=1701104 RepID=UPI0013D7ED13|nr:WYL domain-containing protein [Endozoicomonas acroporae]
MNKRQSSLETTILIIELLKRIPKSWWITAQQLKQQLAEIGLDRDIHTIQRHMKSLVESSHFPIDMNNRSKPYGYRWSQQAVGFTVNALSIQESLILQMAHKTLKNLLPSSLMDSMSGFFEEANRNISHAQDPAKEIQWLSKVVVAPETQPLLPPELQPDVFNEVSSALYNNYWLDITYRNAGGEVKDKNVMPLGLAQQGPRLYLVCRFKGYDDERNLAMHRMLSARSTSMTFERPEGFDLKQYSKEARFTFGEGRKVKLSFRIRKDAGLHILESRISEDQAYREHEDCYEISATVVESRQLQWWLNSFGEDAWAIDCQSIEAVVA